ncbi:Nitrous oxide reductase maturation protein NosD [Thioalkalivibrio nitratireducens DSM 14787]|uniref:Nitrous oxide reductase maturation protein NosD n=1 Tax=Thioalkalivibrio nitratireducens (strain DSM 14787 / UNIQEM 213 / ALEN2) TaxID=1255043 RepID=L0DY43_THIND|nr:Nitrous oxide reductase maturation protein NosD [Thioalkalivibrio nitratireducens DSM 14787]
MRHDRWRWAIALLLWLPPLFAGAEGNAPPPLQALIDAAEPGATVTVPAGTHRGGLVIDRPLTLAGVPGAVLDGQGQGDIVRVQSPDVTIRELTLENSGENLTLMNAGIHADRDAHNLRVENTVMKNVLFGVWVWHSENARITGNTIRGKPQLQSQDRGDGIRLFNVTGGIFAHNDVRDARDGVYVDTSRDLDFVGNRFRDMRFGIHYMYAHDGRIIDNHTTATRSGLALMSSRQLEVTGNRSVNDLNYGILLNFVTDSVVAGNVVTGVRGWAGGSQVEHGVVLGVEGKAFFVYNSYYNVVRDNVFADSDVGIHLTAGSEENAMFGNAFIRNRTQVMYVSTREQEWSHEGRGNFWSDYLGWDLNGDGIGDQPYEPNDLVDKLLWRYPMAKLLMNSPAVATLRWAQQQFPILRPSGVRDSHPLMRPPRDPESA